MFLPAALLAYETDWNDGKLPVGEPPEVKEGEEAPKPILNSRFKLGGQVFSGYEFLDHTRNGAPDASGPNNKIGYGGGNETQGFTLNRVYLNFQAEIVDGPLKGWSFRVTPDAGRAASSGLGCGGSGGTTAVNSCNNEYTMWLKFAFVNIPLFKGARLRLGQQNVPMINGAVVNLEDDWGHRYIDQTAFEFLGMSASADRGIAFYYKNDYFGLHTLLANGEGFRKGNGQNTFVPSINSSSTGAQRVSALDSLSTGAGDSYALDLSNMISIIPTGKNEKHQFSVNFPFRLQNVYGMDYANETRFYQLDITGAAPTYSMLMSDSRSKRDYSYGIQTDYTFKSESGMKFSVGAGEMVKVDRRGSAYIVDNTIVAMGASVDLNTLSQHIRVDQDAKGHGQFIYASVKAGMFGAFIRYLQGTSSDGTLNGQVGVASSRSYLQQALATPLYNLGLPASYHQLRNPSSLTGTVSQNGYDPGKSRFQSVAGGVTFHVTPLFRVTLGLSVLIGTDRNGQRIQTNALERVSGNAATGTGASTLNSQIAANSAAKGAIGLTSTDPLNINYFIGKNVDNKQVFLRSEFAF